MQNLSLLASRVLIAHIFILAAGPTVLDASGRAGYMASVGLPGVLALPSALFELGAALCVLAGFQTRFASWALAGFCLVVGYVFHFRPDDPMQMLLFMKDFAMAGGLLALAAAGAGGLSLDAKLTK